MTIPTSLTRAVRRAMQANSATSKIPQDPVDLRAQPKPKLRRYEVSSLLPDGSILETRHIAPALPLFEDAFCAFLRGSLVETDRGPVAVESLVPGDQVMTRDGTPQPMIWKGSTTLIPGRPGPHGRDLSLTRFTTDVFGTQRPVSPVMVGPSARLLHTPDHLRAISGDDPVLTPALEFLDGTDVIETAPTTVIELFHICLPRHAAIRIAGLEVESYHPGRSIARATGEIMRSVFLNLFPHIDQLCDFGDLAFPRIGEGQFDAISA